MKKILSFSVAALIAVMSSSAFAEDKVVTLDLNTPSNPETFTFGENGVWTETYNESDYTYFESQIFMFSHLMSGNSWGGYSWDGFTVSKNADWGDLYAKGWVANQWGCMAQGGIKTDDNGEIMKNENGSVQVDSESPYLLAYLGYGEKNVQMMFNDGATHRCKGVYVTNAPWAFYGTVHGDGSARAFDEGDKLTLTFHGVAKDESEKTVDVVLAKYEDGMLSAIRNWKYIDLTSLGEVESIYCTMTSTDLGDFGMNTAAYFCLDKLQVYSNSSTSAVDAVAKAGGMSYDRKAQAIVAGEEMPIAVYDTKGAVVLFATTARLSVDSLPQGVYVVKNGKVSMKIVK